MRFTTINSDETKKRIADAVRKQLDFHSISETPFDEEQLAFVAVRALLDTQKGPT
jgi:hypothetical protein